MYNECSIKSQLWMCNQHESSNIYEVTEIVMMGPGEPGSTTIPN